MVWISRVVSSQRWLPMKQSLLSMTLEGEICAGIGTCPTTSSRGEEEEVEEAEERTGLIRSIGYQGVRSYA
jgi:hypothetical protein